MISPDRRELADRTTRKGMKEALDYGDRMRYDPQGADQWRNAGRLEIGNRSKV